MQISLDEALLERVDRDAETKKLGRSAVIARALEHYLEARRRRAIDLQSKQGYGKAALEAEAVDLMAAQAWPDEK